MRQSRTLREQLVDEARALLGSLGEGSMSETAYDTAWVARLSNPSAPEEPLFPAAYDWLLRNQHPDGSWGAEIAFAHDRVISTLAALTTLARSPFRRQESEPAARRAILYLNRERPNLRDDPAETVGFELILPELARQAQALGLRLPYEDWAFVEAIKADKLKRIPPVAVYGGPTPLTHSLEYRGENLWPTLVTRCRFPDGSFGLSPSTTAYVYSRVPDDGAVQYLDRLAGLSSPGGIPYVHPFETFETSWVLNLLDPLVHGLPEVMPLVKRLAEAWTPKGLAWTGRSPVPDADDTAVALCVLASHGHPMGTEVFESFETDDYFWTFTYERNPSVTTNAHILSALRQYPGTPERRRMVLKIGRYLEKAQRREGYWLDKWHASALYATGQAIVALAGLSDEVVRSAVQWVLAEQHENGSWGFEDGTQEETGWAVHALATVSQRDAPLRALTASALEGGVAYLADHLSERGYPALWIGKSLYTPINVVRATVLAALHQAVVSGVPYEQQS